MKKKRIVIAAILCVSVCIIGAVIGKRIISEASNAGAMGYYLRCSNGSHMIILIHNGDPCVMRTDDDSIFDGLTNGDVISAVCGPVQESYPARTEVYTLDFIRDGSIDDIPAATLSSLKELGWYE